MKHTILVVVLSVFLAPVVFPLATSHALSIEYKLVDLPDINTGGDLSQYNYYLKSDGNTKLGLNDRIEIDFLSPRFGLNPQLMALT